MTKKRGEKEGREGEGDMERYIHTRARVYVKEREKEEKRFVPILFMDVTEEGFLRQGCV